VCMTLYRVTVLTTPGWSSCVVPSALPAAFLELVPPQAGGLAECLIELDGPHGKMRIQWKGTYAPDLAGLSRVLWEWARVRSRRRDRTSVGQGQRVVHMYGRGHAGVSG